jgi:hypothetical protein
MRFIFLTRKNLFMKIISFVGLAIVILAACQKQTVQTAPEQNKLTQGKAFFQLREAGMQQSPPTIAKKNNANKVTKEWHSDLTAHIVGFVDNYCGESTSGVLVTGTGHAVHLGNISTDGSACYPSSPFQVGAITASNGDKVFFQQVSFGNPVPLPTWGYVITGGTGRFLGASGSFDLVYSVFDHVNNIFISESTGTISY